MKKWIALLIVIFIIVIWTSIDTYRTANLYRTEQGDQAINVAKEQEPDLEITDITFYNGNQSYTIIYGRIGEKTQIFCVPTDEKGEVIIIDPKNGISAEEAVNLLTEERNPSSIQSVNLGIEQNVPIWEIIYLDQNNRYTYYYVTFEDGEFIKRYTL
ncbi:PepSY domain-containing protein [Bacillus sp. AK128]